MPDYASVIGGDSEVGLDDIAPDQPGYFHLDETNFLDRSGASGESEVLVEDSAGDAEIRTGSGDDFIQTGSNNDSIHGGAGNDSIDAGGGNNTVVGGAGEDILTAGPGSSELFGGNGSDVVESKGGDHFLSGGGGADTLVGQNGQDTLSGGSGDDWLEGRGGNDILLGGSGADTLIGGEGDDVLTGGSGGDAFFFDSNFGHDVIMDFSRNDQIWLKANLNGSNIHTAEQVANFVEGGVGPGGVKYTKITIGENSITLQGVDKDDFLNNLSSWVKIHE